RSPLSFGHFRLAFGRGASSARGRVVGDHGLDGATPLGEAGGALVGGHQRFVLLGLAVQGAEVVQTVPGTGAKAGKGGGARGGGFAARGDEDGNAKEVCLALHEPAVGGHAAIDAEAVEGGGRILAGGSDQVGYLEGYPFQGRPAQVGGGGAAGQAKQD